MDKIEQRALIRNSRPEGRDHFVWIETRLPRRRNAQVGVPVVVPIVVDVEAIGIEIADVHAVAVRVEKFARSRPCHRTLRFTEGLAPHSYSLSILNVFWEQSPMRLGNISTRNGQEVQISILFALCRNP